MTPLTDKRDSLIRTPLAGFGKMRHRPEDIRKINPLLGYSQATSAASIMGE